MSNHKKIVGVVGKEAFYFVVFIFFSEMERHLPMNPKVGCRQYSVKLLFSFRQWAAWCIEVEVVLHSLVECFNGEDIALCP